MAQSNIKAKVLAMLAPIAAAEGVEIWNINPVRSKGAFELRVYLDKDGGISLNDLEKISRLLEQRLDAEDVIEGQYSLVVSSPGMDRKLFTDAHFARYLGKPVEVSLFAAVEGQKRFAALLGARDAVSTAFTPIDTQTLMPTGKELVISNSNLSKVNLMVVI